MPTNSCSYNKSFIAAADLLITRGMSTKEAKAEIETHLVIVEAKISKFLI